MSITELLAGIPVNAVQRQRIEALLQDNERLKQETALLKDENDKLRREIALHEKQLVNLQPTKDSITFRGVLFKGVSKGADRVELHCAKCGTALSAPSQGERMVCDNCGLITWFNRDALPKLLKTLLKQ